MKKFKVIEQSRFQKNAMNNIHGGVSCLSGFTSTECANQHITCGSDVNYTNCTFLRKNSCGIGGDYTTTFPCIGFSAKLV